MSSVVLRLPFPPSLNRIWRAVQGRVVLSVPAREWMTQAVNAMPTGRIPPPLTGRLAVTMSLHAPASYGRRAWDIANREKLAMDFLTKQRVWLDDEQIDMLLITRGVASTDKGYVDILIQECDASSNIQEFDKCVTNRNSFRSGCYRCSLSTSST